MKRLCATAVTLLCAACVPATPTLLKEEPALKRSFEVDEGYQAVYRTLVTQSRKCFQAAGALTAPIVVTGDLYTDIRQGQISLDIQGLGTMLAVDVIALSEARTRVHAYSAYSEKLPGHRRVYLLEEWAVDHSTECELRRDGEERRQPLIR